MSFHYRITIESMSRDASTNRSLSFEVSNHDDIIVIAEKIKNLNWLNPSEAYAAVVGLKKKASTVHGIGID